MGLWFAFALVLEKLFLGKILSWLPKAVGIVYTMLVVLVGWVLFALENSIPPHARFPSKTR